MWWLIWMCVVFITNVSYQTNQANDNSFGDLQWWMTHSSHCIALHCCQHYLPPHDDWLWRMSGTRRNFNVSSTAVRSLSLSLSWSWPCIQWHIETETEQEGRDCTRDYYQSSIHISHHLPICWRSSDHIIEAPVQLYPLRPSTAIFCQ